MIHKPPIDELAKKTGWKCFCTSTGIDADVFVREIEVK